jgi:hypothetical protein
MTNRQSQIPSRRAVLAGIAAATALAAPVLALSGPDPIFAAIECHKASNAALSAICHLDPGPGASPEEHDEWERREDEAGSAERDDADQMVATIPTTFAGLLALLRYVEREHARGETFLDQDGLEKLISTTVSALEAIGGA